MILEGFDRGDITISLNVDDCRHLANACAHAAVGSGEPIAEDLASLFALGALLGRLWGNVSFGSEEEEKGVVDRLNQTLGECRAT